MNSDDSFLRHWFSGVDSFLESETDGTAERFLAKIAEGCSQSYSKGLYVEAFSENRTLTESLEYLSSRFSDFDYEMHDDGIEIIYRKCSCDLVNDKLIRSPKICGCSERSLLYNWEQIYGRGNVQVAFLASILRGDSRCRFEVRVRQLGHQLT